MANKTFQVETPVNHNQKDYAPGASIKLDDEFSAPLLAVGAISDPSAKAPVDGGDATK